MTFSVAGDLERHCLQAVDGRFRGRDLSLQVLEPLKNGRNSWKNMKNAFCREGMGEFIREKGPNVLGSKKDTWVIRWVSNRLPYTASGPPLDTHWIILVRMPSVYANFWCFQTQ